MSGPLPPKDLANRDPLICEIGHGAVLHRFYGSTFDPIYFDKSEMGRFNAPDGDYGVLYVAHEADGALAETFLRIPGRQLVDPKLLSGKSYVRLRALKSLKLISMFGPGLAVLGATAEVVHSGPPYSVPQNWSAALKSHSVGADGIAYRSRHDDAQLCYALWDDAKQLVIEIDRLTNLDNDWFWGLAGTYKMGRPPL